MAAKQLTAIRGTIVHCLRDPGESNDPDALQSFEDGLLLVEDGRVVEVGPAEELLRRLPSDLSVEDARGRLIIPGFIDVHMHYVQTDVIASYGEQLLSWLNRYTFPTEGRFGDAELAAGTADFFLEELLRNGTTSALVFGSVHPESADAFFAAAQRRRMRMIAGKVLMDRNAPDFLLDTPERGYQESRELIERWHGVDRLSYAITPRFAPTSTEAQLELSGKLAAEFPDVYIQTHVAENRDEVAWVAELFPWSRSYLDVYDRYGLLRERAVYAHCIYLDEQDRERMAESGAAAAFCPTSNTFLGSGLFDYRAARGVGMRVGLATDVGGGTSFSMLKTAAEAYKVAQLSGSTLSAERLLYLATLGSAEALYMEDRIGSFQPGREADFVVVNPGPTPLMERRHGVCDSLSERLFSLFILGDDRNIESTWIQGEKAYQALS